MTIMREPLNRPFHIEDCESSRLQREIRKQDSARQVSWRGQWSIGATGGAGTDDGCRLPIWRCRSLEGELTPTIGSAHALFAVWLHVKQKPKPSLLLLRPLTTRNSIRSFEYVWMLPTTALKSYRRTDCRRAPSVCRWASQNEPVFCCTPFRDCWIPTNAEHKMSFCSKPWRSLSFQPETLYSTLHLLGN